MWAHEAPFNWQTDTGLDQLNKFRQYAQGGRTEIRQPDDLIHGVSLSEFQLVHQRNIRDDGFIQSMTITCFPHYPEVQCPLKPFVSPNGVKQRHNYH